MKKAFVPLLLLMLMLTQCNLFRTEQAPLPMPTPRSWSEICQHDTLRAITLQTFYTAFEYHGKWYGHEYEIADRVAKELNLVLDIQFVSSEKELADSLFTGAADIAIWPASKSVFDTLNWLLPVGPMWQTDQVLVSARKLKPIASGDTTTHYQLALREYSRQWLVFHDDSVRAHFDFSPYAIDTISADSLTTDQMTDAMMEGRTDLVMLRCNVARAMKEYYPTLHVSDPLPYSTDSVSWLIAQGSDTLRQLIDSICIDMREIPNYSITQKRLYEQRNGRHRAKRDFMLTDGGLSPYDEIFKKYGKEIGWDWRLLAAIGYIESKLDHTQISTRGPIGLMQLMPATVNALGYSQEEVIDPDTNVKVASILIGRLTTTLRNKLPEVSERDLIQFTLAGYNAGLGHVYDAIYLADTLGYDTNVWANNVEHCLRLKSDPDYYSYPKVKLGRFNGAFTINYISGVLDMYDVFCTKVPLEE